MVLWEKGTQAPERERSSVAPGNFLDWQESSSDFQRIAAFTRWDPVSKHLDGGEKLRGVRITENFFDVVRVSPFLGAGFSYGSRESLDPRQVVISFGYWLRRFGGDPRVVGQTLLLRELNGAEEPYVLVGVMPQGFEFPTPFFPQKTEVWSLLSLQNSRQDRKGRALNVLSRLGPDTSVEKAKLRMREIARQLEAEHPATNRGWGIEVVPLQEQITGNVRTPLVLLIASVLGLQLAACVNAANLFLARTVARQKELAVRSALGASRQRLVGLLFAEAVVLATFSGGLSALLSWFGIGAVPAIAPASLPFLGDIKFSWQVFAFVTGLSFITCIAVSAGPAWGASQISPATALREPRGTDSRGPLAWNARRLLTISQVALSVTLLITSFLLFRSFIGIQQTFAGMDIQRVLSFRVVLPGSRYSEFHRRTQFHQELLEPMRRMEDVASVAAVSSLPYNPSFESLIHASHSRVLPEEPDLKAEVRLVMGDYFQTLSVPLKHGRFFTAIEELNPSAKVAVVNRTLANRLWGDGGALGKQISIQYEAGQFTVIGIVDDARRFGPAGQDNVAPQVFIAHSSAPRAGMTFLVRTKGRSPYVLVNQIRGFVASLDKGVAMDEVSTLEDLWQTSFSNPHLLLTILTAFAVAAFALAIAGVYGFVSYSVSRRIREFGIRLALGATPGNIVKTIVQSTLGLASLGVVIGIGGSLFIGRALRALLFDVGPTDPATYFLVTGLVLISAMVASFLPARRASRSDPVAALRSE